MTPHQVHEIFFYILHKLRPSDVFVLLIKDKTCEDKNNYIEEIRMYPYSYLFSQDLSARLQENLEQKCVKFCDLVSIYHQSVVKD